MSPAALPKTLVDALVQGSVIPFVGAGVSMAVRRKDDTPAFPSWKALLLRAADRIQAEGRPEHSVVRAMLEQTPPDYMESARWARKGLGSHWATFLGECFGIPRKEVDDQSLALARKLWQLGSRLVITTNYDRVLRWSCTEAEDIDEWPIEAPAGQVAALRRALVNPTVWHLHGSVTDPTKIILSPDGYAQLYTDTDDSQESRYRAALETLRQLMAKDHLLFVGFSLDDPFLKRQLEWVRDTFQGCTGPHYVLARKSEIEGMREKVEGLELGFVEFESFGERMLAKLDELVATRSRAEHASALVVHPAPETRVEPPRVAPTRLTQKATKLFGREQELAQLDAEWASSHDGKVNVAVIVAWGGVGKTSLVFEWMNRLAAQGHRGATAVFDWSFYSQGVKERGAASGDAFVREALRFFGDEAMADSAASAWDKGARLAELVGRQRALLVLDGLEPLQHPPGRAVMPGKLTDPAIAALLRGLARTNAGLCVVTTRERVEDLDGFGAVSQRSLDRLSEEAGVELLRFLLGDYRLAESIAQSIERELRDVCETVKGHALTLTLLGRFLHRRKWDVRRWREIRFEDADQKVQGGHAFHMLGAYERWLAGNDGETVAGGQRMLAVLRILGLFDRPADPGCIGAICEEEAIAGLTEPLVGLDEGEWADVLADLESLGLVSREPWEPARIEGFSEAQANLRNGRTSGEPAVTTMPGWSRLKVELDAHPLVREHFGRRVRETSETAWTEGHRRVFEHLVQSTPYWPEGEEGLRPLFQAVAHGCQAGEVQRACLEVYRDRIQRGTSDGGFYSAWNLGAFGAELGALAWMFESPWSRPSSSLSAADQAWLLNEAAFGLKALGRLAEAVEPMRTALERLISQESWKQAAIGTSNLSQLELTRGEVTETLREADRSITFADRSADAFQRMVNRTAHADALHHAGDRDEARRRFEEAEAIQAERQPLYPRLYTLQGFLYCDLLLFEAERAAWWVTMEDGMGTSTVASDGDARSTTPRGTTAIAGAACDDVLSRAAQTLAWVTPQNWLLDIALDHLTLGRASLYRALLTSARPHPGTTAVSTPASGDLAEAEQHLHAAVEGLRRSGETSYLPRGLLTRAWLHHLLARPFAATTDLDEAESLATRCGMPIFLANVHLTRARLFRSRTALAHAKSLLDQLRTKGYRRHDDMLADAEAAATHWPDPPLTDTNQSTLPARPFA